MHHKGELERRLDVARLTELREQHAHAPVPAAEDDLDTLSETLRHLDDRIAPLAQAAGELANPSWGPVMRAGIDKSLFARQVERYADVYTSRVSNLGLATPFAYLRAPRSPLPHDGAEADDVVTTSGGQEPE